MWISRKEFENLKLEVHFLKEKVNGRSFYETFVSGQPKDISLRKGFNLLIEYLGLEYAEGRTEPDKFVKVK